MRKYGFTLVEILIVLIIVGILASLLIQQYQYIKRTAEGAEAKQNLGLLTDSIWRYYVETGRFPWAPYPQLPKDIDVKLPNYYSEYFTYTYVIINPECPFFDAVDASSLPDGAIDTYRMGYTTDSSYLLADGIGCKMDDKYYRFYEYHIKKRGTSGTWKRGWP